MVFANIFNAMRWIILLCGIAAGSITILIPDPQDEYNLFLFIGVDTGRPYTNTSAVVPVILILIGLFVAMQMTFYMMKVESDRVVGAGMDRTESCIAATLHKYGDFAFIRAGGAKAFGWEGSQVWFNPLTHVHVIKNTIWLEAHMTPNMGLDVIPTEMKDDILQRSEGILGVRDCSVGFLTPNESQTHGRFNGADYTESKGEDKKMWNTSDFIIDTLTKIRTIHTNFLFLRDDANSIADKVAAIKKIGNAASDPEKKGLIDYLTGSG